MKPAILGIIIIIILLIIGIFFALIAFSYTQIHVTLDDVTIDSIDWASSL